MSLVTTKEAAQILGVTPVRVRQLIKEQWLAAEKHGGDHLLQDWAVERFKQHGRRSGPKGGRAHSLLFGCQSGKLVNGS